MELLHNIVVLVAGVSFFMYGMTLASENLQVIAADRVRALMSRLAQYPILGIFIGIALTTLLQSSSAVTVMMVNLASASVVTLAQVMGILIGTAIGTTVTVQLISFNVTAVAFYFVIAGFLISFLTTKKKVKEIGNIVFGFGLVFYGLMLMGQAISIVKDIAAFKDIFTYLNQNPVVTVLVTSALCAIVHSSAVVIGLSMTLATNGLISLYDSMFWIYGANIGTTGTALLASLQCNFLGRQVAWANFFYKLITVVGFMFFTTYLSDMSSVTSPVVSRQIANAHTLLNVLGAIAFYPFINLGSRLIQYLFPRPESEQEFGPKYLDKRAFNAPAMAFANAVREMLRMSEFALEMVKKSPRAFEVDDPDFTDDIREIDKKVDLLNREIKHYLVRLTDEKLTELQNSRVINFIALVSDIEHIGDVIDKTVLDLAKKKSRLKVTFSDEGWAEVKSFHKLVVENFELALSAFSLHNKELAEKVIENKHALRLLEQKLKGSHIKRLHRKMQASINTSSIHLDLLSAYRRVNSYACNLVYPIIYSDPEGLFPSDVA